MGYGTVVLDPDPAAPAGRVADEHLVAPYDDPAALDRLAATCAVVTTEFENPPAAALERLAADVIVAPPPHAVAVAQDRIAEKRFLADLGVPTAPFAVAGTAERVGFPAIVKTARLGYDGKGQREVGSPAELAAALDELGRGVRRGGAGAARRRAQRPRRPHGRWPHGRVPGRREPSRRRHPRPHRGTGSGRRRASRPRRPAWRCASPTHLRFVGVLAVELFVSDGRLLVNELAPRPHNSGHWTLDAARTSQFEQQIRAVCGLALGAADPTVGAWPWSTSSATGGRMENPAGRACWPSRRSGCTSTARRLPDRGARWVT